VACQYGCANQSLNNMSVGSESHTVLWVPRYWPALGGTEFHSHELACHLLDEQRVTVLTHCTETESQHQALAESAAISAGSDTCSNGLRTVQLFAPSSEKKLLAYLGAHYSHNVFARRWRQILLKYTEYRLCLLPMC